MQLEVCKMRRIFGQVILPIWWQGSWPFRDRQQRFSIPPRAQSRERSGQSCNIARHGHRLLEVWRAQDGEDKDLNFWLPLKRNTLAVVLRSYQGRYPECTYRDQLVAQRTSWIEAKNDEDGTGCHGGGGGDESRMTMKTQRELRLVELLLLWRSTAAREMGGTMLLRKRSISWAHGGD